MTISGVGIIILILQKSPDTSLTSGNNEMRLFKLSIPGRGILISLEEGFCCFIYCCISCPDILTCSPDSYTDDDNDGEGEEGISRYHLYNLIGCQAALYTN